MPGTVLRLANAGLQILNKKLLNISKPNITFHQDEEDGEDCHPGPANLLPETGERQPGKPGWQTERAGESGEWGGRTRVRRLGKEQENYQDRTII